MPSTEYVDFTIGAKLPDDLEIQAVRISYRTTNGQTVSPYSLETEVTLVPIPVPEPAGGLLAGALMLAVLARRKR